MVLLLLALLWASPAVGAHPCGWDTPDCRVGSAATSWELPKSAKSAKPATVYAGELLRVVDGDTLRVRIETTPDHYWTPSIRFLNVDSPELKGKCENERGMARMAKDFVERLLPPASYVTVTKVKLDKYGGRYLGEVSIDGRQLSGILIDARLARLYDGGKRQSWC